MDPSEDTTSGGVLQSKRRKKRLSRKEQKAGKKQKATTTTPAAPTHSAEIPTPAPPVKEETPTSSTDAPEEDYSVSYVPTPRPVGPHDSQKKHTKSLGKWFPKAVVLKTKAPPNAHTAKSSKASIVLFYQYVNPVWPEAFLADFVSYLCTIAEARGLGGRIRVAREGVNATLSSRDNEAAAARQTLRHFALDLQGYDKVFAETDFKYMDYLSADRHFKDFKVFPVQELVFYGLPSDKTVGKDELGSMQGGVHLDAEEFHQKLTDPNTVVVDVRNHYESVLGRFDGQRHKESKGTGKERTSTVKDAPESSTESIAPDSETGKEPAAAGAAAEYIDPRMRKSTDWTRWLEKDDTKKKLEGKQVLLYCTGGIRCERASVYLNQKMGDKVKGVYQLKGGVERYFKAFPDGGFWRGKNFVFDKREAVDISNPDGDGGVISNDAKTDERGLPKAKCCRCDKPWDRYVGKKKCNTCGVPVLVCDSCLSEIGGKKEKELGLRCPLCIEENVTIAAKDVEWTDNGMGGKVKGELKGAAAPSVLKWGGGHGAEKKDKRRFKRQPCRFGGDCRRKDCFFAHPSTDTKEHTSA
jgi:predicted sulfurtransferase